MKYVNTADDKVASVGYNLSADFFAANMAQAKTDPNQGHFNERKNIGRKNVLYYRTIDYRTYSLYKNHI